MLMNFAAALAETTEQAVSVASDDSDPTEVQGPYDSISQTSFSRTITISWSGSSASVEGDEKGIVSVSGSRVTADSRSSAPVPRCPAAR